MPQPNNEPMPQINSVPEINPGANGMPKYETPPPPPPKK